MAADRAVNNFSANLRLFVISDIRGLYAKFLLVGGMGRIHPRVDKVWKLIKYFLPENSGFIFPGITSLQMN